MLRDIGRRQTKEVGGRFWCPGDTDFGGIYCGEHILPWGYWCRPMPPWISTRTWPHLPVKVPPISRPASICPPETPYIPEPRPGNQRAQNLTPSTCGLALALGHTLMAPAATGMETWPHPPAGWHQLQDSQSAMVRNPGIQPHSPVG